MNEDLGGGDMVPYDEPSGVWVATLEDAGVLEIKLSGEAAALRDCEIVRVDDRAMLITKKGRQGTIVQTLLIPTSSISYVAIKPDRRRRGAFARAMSGES